jgi:acyl-CoA oxidase
MNRIKSLNAHFAPPSTHVAVRKGNFTDSFSYLNLDKYLSAEGIELRNKTREFMAYVEKSMYDNTETAEMPMWVVPAMGKLGIVGADLPKEYGGKAMNMTDLGVCMYELAYGDASVSTFFLLHNSLSHYTVLKLAQEELRRRIFAETLDCKKILCWCLTEPENGSDASGLRTTAKKVYNWVDGKVVKGYVING